MLFEKFWIFEHKNGSSNTELVKMHQEMLLCHLQA